MSFDIKKYKEIRDYLENNPNYNRLKKPTSIISVTKNKPLETVELAIKEGVRVFGENRVQEAAEKFTILKQKHKNIELHMIGQLQSNKVKKAIKIFDYFHTLDRESLANEFVKNLNMTQNKKSFFVQVNTGLENQKSGIAPKLASDFIKHCINDLNLNIVGLMCLPPVNEDPKKHFLFLKDILDKNNLDYLSMGMSSDYKTAVECGSTHIRIGTLLYGQR